MKTHTAIEIKIPKKTFLAFIRERFPELPSDVEVGTVTSYESQEEVTIKLSCDFKERDD